MCPLTQGEVIKLEVTCLYAFEASGGLYVFESVFLGSILLKNLLTQTQSMVGATSISRIVLN